MQINIHNTSMVVPTLTHAENSRTSEPPNAHTTPSRGPKRRRSVFASALTVQTNVLFICSALNGNISVGNSDAQGYSEYSAEMLC